MADELRALSLRWSKGGIIKMTFSYSDYRQFPVFQHCILLPTLYHITSCTIASAYLCLTCPVYYYTVLYLVFHSSQRPYPSFLIFNVVICMHLQVWMHWRDNARCESGCEEGCLQTTGTAMVRDIAIVMQHEFITHVDH